jgi:drug/metabolite transporter (DMT)-like permease
MRCIPTPEVQAMEKTHRAQAFFLLGAAAVLWSLGGLLIKWVSLPAPAVAGYRSAISLLVLLLYFRRGVLDFSIVQWGGGVSYAAMVILFVFATKLTTAGNAILLQYTAPVFVALFSGWVLGEKTRWFDWAAIAAVMCGMSLFFLDRLSSGQAAGNMMAILSGMSFASMVLFLRKQKDASPAGSVILGNFLTALVCLPGMAQSAPGGMDWLGLLLLGVFQLGVSYIMYAIAIKRVTAMEGILIPMVEPILNPLWTFLFLDEKLGPWAIVGGFIVILSLLFRSVMSSRQD